MQLSAIYPKGFGRALGQIMTWLRDGASHGDISAFAEILSQERPSPEEAFAEAQAAARAIGWQDQDPGFPSLSGLCLTKPKRDLVKRALRKRKAQLESQKAPFTVSDEEDRDSSSPSLSDDEDDDLEGGSCHGLSFSSNFLYV